MTTPTPGWYADSNTPGTERWWNGESWTEDTRVAVATPALTNGYGQYAPTYQQPQFAAPASNGIATAGMWCGIAGLVINPLLIVGILALILGGIGKTRANQTGVGARAANAAITLGVIDTVFTFFYLVYIANNV